MTPNSNFDFPMPLEGDRFKPGTYTYSAEVYSQKDDAGKFTYGKDDKGMPQHYRYHWQFKKDFTITGSNALKLNLKDVTVKPDRSWIYLLIAGVLTILLLLIFFILWKRRKKEEDDDNNENNIEKEK